MAEDARLAYLQARLQARHGDRPSADEWRLAESSADLSHYLEAIRRTALKRWVSDINHEMAPEAIERQFRAAWREAVGQVAQWSPEEWRPAVEWLRWLPDLPALAHLLRGRKVPPWMHADPVLRELAFEEPERRREALAGLPLAPLNPDGETGADQGENPDERDDGRDGAAMPPVVAAWVHEWRRRVPGGLGNHREALADILEQVLRHIEAMRASEDSDGRELRNLLGATLARHFRHGAGTPIALFSHLALDGLELERVRAGVVTRRLMPERPEGRSWA
jgi:hypothetical protein